MGITESIIIGVVSGLITGFCALTLSQIFRKIVRPWYESLIYDGIKIEGTWHIEFTDPTHNRNVTFELNQKANTLTGISTHVLKDEKKSGDKIRTYQLSGRIRNRFIDLSGRSIDRTRVGVLTMLFEIIGDGQKMHGYITGYSTLDSELKSLYCVASRTSIASITPQSNK